MKRIMVVGVSAGAGKSTFARKLGERLHIPVYHLDTFYWKSNWVEASEIEFYEAQLNLVKHASWIIEGNYTGTLHLRMEETDTIIYIERSLPVCLYRVLKRYLQNRGKVREDLGEGCIEKLDWPFIKFIVTTYFKRKEMMQEHFTHFLAGKGSRKVIQLKNKKQIRDFFQT
ncbi:topology modulation protein [Alkalihalophilus lindianensis]|uniref:Topology modulation protein n=1 Tax=Alkalihalophilus lindianensis TaxID=1630542 RepID=A0ABU3X8B8_9BACI|nr:topology modulation protein [Alkalihalophilus lindianensis]MDV2683684.1 topology modulation protein [Alkalihalophilus lindianensis]